MSSTNISHARTTAFLRGFPAKNGLFSAVLTVPSARLSAGGAYQPCSIWPMRSSSSARPSPVSAENGSANGGAPRSFGRLVGGEDSGGFRQLVGLGCDQSKRNAEVQHPAEHLLILFRRRVANIQQKEQVLWPAAAQVFFHQFAPVGTLGLAGLGKAVTRANPQGTTRR